MVKKKKTSQKNVTAVFFFPRLDKQAAKSKLVLKNVSVTNMFQKRISQNVLAVNNDIHANRAEQCFFVYIIIVRMQRSKCICNEKQMN